MYPQQPQQYYPQQQPPPHYGNFQPQPQYAPPQPQPQYVQPQYAPPPQPQYAPPQHQPYTAPPPQQQPQYTPQPQYAPPQQQQPPPQAAAPASQQQHMSVEDRDSNPFGPGKLPKVTPVTQVMRLQRAAAAAKRAEAKRNANSDNNNSSPSAAAPASSSSSQQEYEAKALEAMNEHNYPQIGLMENLGDHEQRFGSGILYYFSFNRFLLLLCLVFCVFQVITFGNYIREHDPEFGLSGNTTAGVQIWLDQFMITHYQDSDKRLWYAMNVICIVITFFSAPIYFWWLRWNEATSQYVDIDGEDVIVRFTDDGKIDVSNMYRTQTDVFIRRVISLLVVLMFIGVQVVASFYISNIPSTDIGLSFAISIITAVLNLVFMNCAERLTEFEKWKSFEKWKRYHTLKLLFFKLANVITVFAAKRYDTLEDTKCAYDVIGEQLITLLIIDIFAINIQKIILAMIFRKFAQTIAGITGSIFGDQDNLPKFDIAVEYLGIVYRQYLVIMAMVVCPFSIFLALVGYLLDFVVNKFILLRLCGVPRKVESSQKALLTFVLFFVALCGLLTPFAGSMFMLAGLTRDKSKLCQFPQ